MGRKYKEQKGIGEKQKHNLTRKQERGLKTLRERIKKEDFVICQTEKTNKFCVVSRDAYIQIGEEHTSKDRKIENEEIK